MSDAAWIAIGAAAAIAWLAWVRRLRPAARWTALGAGLVVAALVYVGFAAWGGAGGRWLGVELLGVAVYGGLAWAGRRVTPWLISLGWALHVVWDVLLHGTGAAGTAFVPAWYPPACIGFDLVVAVAAARWARVRS